MFLKTELKPLKLEWLIGFNVMLVCLFSPFVKELSLIHLVSATLSVFAVLAALLRIISSGYVIKMSAFPLMSISYLTLIAVWAFAVGVSANDVVRAYLPFIYLPVFCLLGLSLKPWEMTIIIRFLLFCGLSLATLVFPFLFQNYNGSISMGRFTAYSDLSHTPLLLISIPLIYLCFARYRIIFVTLVLLTIMATMSKGQIMLALMALITCELICSKSRTNLIVKLFLSAFLIFILVVNFGGGLVERFSNFTGETTFHRLEEIKLSIHYFLERPLFGWGAGLTFDLTELKTSTGDEQRYIHNLVFYLMATGGLVGMFFYFLPYFVIFFSSVKNREVKLILVALAVAFGYLLVSATFKSIQTNIFIGLLLASAFKYGHNHECK